MIRILDRILYSASRKGEEMPGNKRMNWLVWFRYDARGEGGQYGSFALIWDGIYPGQRGGKVERRRGAEAKEKACLAHENGHENGHHDKTARLTSSWMP